MADNIAAPAPTPKLDEARDFILENIEDGMEVGELERMAKAAGITLGTIQNARAVLKKDNKIKVKPTGFGKEKKWRLYTVPENKRE